MPAQCMTQGFFSRNTRVVGSETGMAAVQGGNASCRWEQLEVKLGEGMEGNSKGI